MSTPNTTPTAADARSSASYDPIEIRLNSGGTGRIWEMQSGRFGWCHPNGSQGQSASFRAAEDELNAADGTADSARPTPGPWKAVGSHRAWFIQTAEELTHQTPGILNVFSSEAIAELRDKETPEEVQANARLIAAAPALYEALQMMLDVPDPYDFEDKDTQKAMRAREAARAALALAKGDKQ